jgi:hypothetical protein
MEPTNTTNPGISPALAPSFSEEQGIAAVLREVASWRAEREAQHRADLEGVDEEVERLRLAMEDLQRQLTALSDFRTQVEAQRVRVGVETAHRAHGAVFARLEEQAQALDARAAEALAAEPRRRQLLLERLGQSEHGQALREYEQFQANRAQLDALPSSYRDALLAHHDAQGEALSRHLAAFDPGPPTLAADPIELDVVFTVDAAENEPELVSIVLPVHESTYTGWRDREGHLALQVAARAVQGLYEAARGLGLTRAHALYGGHRDLLAVELELGRGTGRAPAARIGAAIQEALSQAPELVAAQVSVRAIQLPAEYLLPPDDDAPRASDEVPADARAPRAEGDPDVA